MPESSEAALSGSTWRYLAQIQGFFRNSRSGNMPPAASLIESEQHEKLVVDQTVSHRRR